MTSKSNTQTILNFYGFSTMPFGKNISYKDIFHTTCLKDAQTMLELGIQTEDILLLSGPIGSGKSVVLRYFIHSLDKNYFTPLYLTGDIASSSELYKRILKCLLIDPPFSPSKAKLVYFKSISDMTKKPLVIIDDAQDVKDSALLAIKSMVNFEQDSKTKITFILSGQPELKENLSFSIFQAIRQRIKLDISLNPMSLEETCAYINHCLKVAGRSSPLFSDNAKSDIFKKSEGILREINSLCFKSIVIGAIKRIDVIDTLDIPFDGI